MKAANYLVVLLLLTVSAGCGSSYYATLGASYTDDLYETHDRAAIARQKQAVAEAALAESRSRQEIWESMLAEAEVVESLDERDYSYDNVLVTDYESAYARRLNGFRSLSYKMPSSYYDLRYSPEYHYLTVYDPMNYNIVVMGDEVWVEPKYISSMFGTWGAPSFSLTIGSGGWYGGFYYDWLWPTHYPYYYYNAWWGYPRYSWWDYNHYWYCGWPMYGPMWPAPMPPYAPPAPHPSKPGKPSTPHYPNYRPAPSGSLPSGVRPSSPYTSPRGNYNYRGGATVGNGNQSNYRGGAQPAGQSPSRPTGSSGNYRGSKPTQSVGNSSNTRPAYGGSSNYQPKEGSSRREESNYRNSSSSSGSNYRSGSSNYNSGASSSGGNYRSSGGSSGGGGNYRSSGGGNYRGR